MCRPGHGPSRHPFTGGHTGPPLRGGGGGSRKPPRPAAHSVASAPAGARKWVGITAEIIPKVPINTGQSLSHGYAVPAPFTKGGLGTGDTDCRVASLLAMTVLNLCHSKEAQRADVGIRPFTMDRGRAAVPRAWPPPAKFRNEIWGVGQVVGPYGSPRLPGQRLAKRKARKESLVKFSLCPTTSECSTAYNVRKPQQSPARVPVGAASTEQNSLEPHPAARQGAPRP